MCDNTDSLWLVISVVALELALGNEVKNAGNDEFGDDHG